jgi:hypothetical protein
MSNFVSYEQMQTIANTIGDNFTTMNNSITALNEAVNDTQGSIAEEFDASKNYDVGDILMYDKKLYKCISPHSAGAWVSADFEETTISQLIEEAQGESSVVGSYENENLFIHSMRI